MSLYERNYFRRTPEYNGTGGIGMLWALIGINAVMYLIVAPPGSEYYNLLGLSVLGGVREANVYQLLTAGFLHGSFSHIFFNLWGLYIFGSLVAPHMSGAKFLALYLAGVILGNGIFLFCNWHGAAFLVGASGAVCAVMAAAAMLEPERKFVILFLPFAPMKTTTLVICYTLLEILFELTGTDRGVAHLAHLGGFFSGYVVMKICFGSRTPWDPFRKLFGASPRPQTSWSRPQPPPPPHPVSTDDSPRVSQRELDELLDKLSRNGINSLSEHEMERLRKARRQMRGEE